VTSTIFPSHPAAFLRSHSSSGFVVHRFYLGYGRTGALLIYLFFQKGKYLGDQYILYICALHLPRRCHAQVRVWENSGEFKFSWATEVFCQGMRTGWVALVGA
jgi:hypothetical protein